MQKKPINDFGQNSEPDLLPSKTRRKQEMHALQDIGEQLVLLDVKRLTELALPEALTDAILEARRIHKHEARRRQMQYIGKLMRDVDAVPILEKFNVWNGATVQHTVRLHLLERWRDRLLADEQAFAELARNYPHADLQHLRALARNAPKEKLANKPPRSFRALFQELQKIIPEESGKVDTDNVAADEGWGH
ncbi:DUF615 domain-containing protein [Nitrosospira lacus]|uniref:Dual-action ribosomal maturation protein DarP n=1 Tax=Nitrosospira lacus TaxID=1288494 RepID=A0A1W6SKQ4_9PROT|nr:ribosome biogenesis factor YjgA [Nitrosospira lacus]ARO86375.1 DUF615 domain-containing protein [Nitrosospira lacus]